MLTLTTYSGRFAALLILWGLSHTSMAEPATEQSIRLLIDSSGSDALYQQVMQQMLPSLKRAIPDASDEFWVEVQAELSTDDMISRLIPVYQQHLNEADVQEIIKFNQSPAGKRLIKAQPLIMQDSMQIGQEWGAATFRKVLEKFQASQAAESNAN